ncbi:MAG: HlyD family efflux transporter periplasmic adaptor subunit [Gammaproteobacteria bacterium]|nr:HlyD family efflux transporter periplasmic adaptor subunit [Gammaproteobacteria bacterium]
MTRVILKTLVLLTFSSPAPAAGSPLLTGVVEDVEAQTIEMPSLPGAWQRRIEWMAQEGTQLGVGDLAVRLDPGDLISREEQVRTELEKRRLSAARRIDELKLELLDAERELARAESAVRMAELDAIIPESTIPRLDFERYQLTLDTAERARVRAQADLLNKRAELKDVEAESELEVQQAESDYQRISDALAATEIRAEKAGFIIYGDNSFTGKKVFPGETLFSGFKIASIASREDLQIRFWVHEADFLDIDIGQGVTVIADAQDSIPFSATIEWTSSQATEKQDWSASGYFEAIANPVSSIPDDVMPGMSVMGELSGPQVKP